VKSARIVSYAAKKSSGLTKKTEKAAKKEANLQK